MPRALEPGVTYPVVLACDKDKTPPPTFLFRAATAREWRSIAATRSGLDAKTLVEHIDETVTAVRLTLAGWKDLGVEFDTAELDNVVGPFELAELLAAVITQGGVSAEEKKSSD